MSPVLPGDPLEINLSEMFSDDGIAQLSTVLDHPVPKWGVSVNLQVTNRVTCLVRNGEKWSVGPFFPVRCSLRLEFPHEATGMNIK